MTFAFNRNKGLIIVFAEVFGPAGSVILRLALDTGATATLLNTAPLVVAGYDPASALERTEVTTESGVEYVARLALLRIVALGEERSGFPVLSHTLPPSAGIDGLLGLDFFRDRLLLLDFNNGRISLSEKN